MEKVVVTIVFAVVITVIAAVLVFLWRLMENHKDFSVLSGLALLELVLGFAFLSYWGVVWATTALKIVTVVLYAVILLPAVFRWCKRPKESNV